MKYFSRKQNQQTQQNTQQGRIILTKSIAIATEFFFKTIYGGSLSGLNIKKDLGFVCDYINFFPISTVGNERCRSVYFGMDEHFYRNSSFRVELRQRIGEEWRVVGFEYPHEKYETYYSVFESHDWFGWKTESCEVVDSY